MTRSGGKGPIVAVLAALSVLLTAPLPALAAFAIRITDPVGATTQVNDGGGGDLNPLANAITVGSAVGGTLITFDTALSNRPAGPPRAFLQLNWSLSGVWAGDPAATVIVATSADGYTFPNTGSASVLTSSVAEVLGAPSSSVLAQQWVDLGNGLFATTGPTPGPQGPFASGSGFLHTASTSFTTLGAYSITDQVILTLGSGAVLTSGTLTSTVVPEPITMFLGGTGLLMLGYAGRKRLLRR